MRRNAPADGPGGRRSRRPCGGSCRRLPAADRSGQGPGRVPVAKALTLKVCKQSKCKYKTITSAVKAAAGGDTIQGRPGHLQGKASGSRASATTT